MMVLVLVVPACIMAVAYAAISNAIINMMVQRRSITGKGQMANGVLMLNGAMRGRRRETEESEVRQVVSMLVVVVVLFVVCWGPILVVNVLKAYGILQPTAPPSCTSSPPLTSSPTVTAVSTPSCTASCPGTFGKASGRCCAAAVTSTIPTCPPDVSLCYQDFHTPLQH
ncbi:uncharacterized protein LOC121871962 [Homarus americanus]|uniref:uncharacterized protein LOC121871962 n=1 Tax=Homarus americanus TaxID=6706 RepID=UPI001C456935|nr:uncharacterized protein LOC121871962 [Homarus americanus]